MAKATRKSAHRPRKQLSTLTIPFLVRSILTDAFFPSCPRELGTDLSRGIRCHIAGKRVDPIPNSLARRKPKRVNETPANVAGLKNNTKKKKSDSGVGDTSNQQHADETAEPTIALVEVEAEHRPASPAGGRHSVEEKIAKSKANAGKIRFSVFMFK